MQKDATHKGNHEISSFINLLISRNFQPEDDSSIQMVFDSDEIIPELKNLRANQYKLHCLINLLIIEAGKLGRKVTYSRIKNDFMNKDYRKKAMVYQVLSLDDSTNLFWDYYFVLDIRRFKLYCFRQITDISPGGDKLFKVVNYLHSNLYKDSEEIHSILQKNNLAISFSQVTHILSEITE